MAELENQSPSSCNGNCGSCGSDCASRHANPEDFRAKLADGCSVKKVIGVVSGKGGVGKSMTSVTAQKLLGSGKIKLKGCKSAKTGNTFDATVYMEVFEDGKTRFNMEFDNGGKRK